MTDFHLQNNIFQISLATLRAFAEIRRSVPRSPTPPRIYISRGDANHRRVLNESELYPALSRFGFTVIKLEQLSLPVQINIFRNAKCVVAPHGAGLTNLGFGNRGTHIFEMLGQGWVNACFNVMVKAMRMHHWVDVYPVSASSVPIFADMTINVPDFIEMLGLIDAHIKVARDLDAMYV
jgi:capsular polysaccharide biosynthesis protein